MAAQRAMAGDDRPPAGSGPSREWSSSTSTAAPIRVSAPQQADPGGVEADLLEPEGRLQADQQPRPRGERQPIEKSPGTEIRSGASRSAGRTAIRRTGPLCMAGTTRSSVTSTSAPAAASMRSVWSRVGSRLDHLGLTIGEQYRRSRRTT